MTYTLESMSPELMFYLASFVDLKGLIALSQVNTSWFNIIWRPEQVSANAQPTLKNFIITKGYPGSPTTLAFLLRLGFDINTLFRQVCRHGNVENMRFLLEQGADIDAADSRGITPLHLACGISCSTPSGHLRSINAVQFLLDRGANLNLATTNDETPLHLACQSSESADVAQLLLERGADPKVVNLEDETPLHLVFFWQSNSTNLVRLLLDKGADPTVVNSEGETPLHLACRHAQSADPLKLLLDGGANPNATNSDGTTPLHLACENPESVDQVRLLLDSGAHPSVADQNGTTPLHLACTYSKSADTVELLLERGAPAFVADSHGTTPLHCVYEATHRKSSKHKTCMPDSLKKARLLIEWGAEVNALNSKGATPIHLACGTGSIEDIQFLLESGANIKAKTEGDLTLLHISTLYKRPDITQFLIERGANIEARLTPPAPEELQGYTPLHYACYSGDAATVKVLLQNGASTYSLNDCKEFPLQVAQKYGRFRVVMLLNQSNYRPHIVMPMPPRRFYNEGSRIDPKTTRRLSTKPSCLIPPVSRRHPQRQRQERKKLEKTLAAANRAALETFEEQRG